MARKGNRHLVPLLFPPGTAPPLRKLSDPEVQKYAVFQNQINFFASTQGSEIHVSGSYVLKDVWKNVTLQNLGIVKVTSQRHRVSTLFSALVLPQQDIDVFYSHMGHSVKINKDIYQVALAVLRVTSIGKHLLNMVADEDLLLFALPLLSILLLIGIRASEVVEQIIVFTKLQ